MQTHSNARSGHGPHAAPKLTTPGSWRRPSVMGATRWVVTLACLVTLGCGDDAGHSSDTGDAGALDSVAETDATQASDTTLETDATQASDTTPVPDTIEDPGVGTPFSRTYYPGGATDLAAGPDGQLVFLGTNRVAAIDPDGEIVWDAMIVAPGAERLLSVRAVDEDLLLAGHEGTLGATPSRGWLMRIGADHRVAWSQNFRVRQAPEAELDGWTVATDIAPKDGGYIACGYSGTDAASTFRAWVLELSPTGEITWIRTYDTPEPGGTLAMSLVRGPDGSFFVQGIQGLSASPLLWVFSVDGDGELLWSRSYGPTHAAYSGTGVTAPRRVAERPGGGFALAAWTRDLAPWVLTFDDGGEFVRQRVITFASDTSPRLSAVALAPDDGLVAVGNYTNGEAGRDLWALALDASNQARWRRGLGDAWNDSAVSVVATDDGGYAISANLGGVNEAGYSASRSGVFKLSSTGSPGPSCPVAQGAPPPFEVTEPPFDVTDLAVTAEAVTAVTRPMVIPPDDQIDFNADQVFMRPTDRREADLCVTRRCANGVRDGDEIGVDCGGEGCDRCPSE